MSELVEFIRGRLDADEQTARAAMSSADDGGPWWVDGPAEVSGKHWVYATGEKFDSPDLAAHIARHDPARVLAEVNAKRAILDMHGFYFEVGRQECECCGGEPWPCRTIRALAQPFRGEPGWRDGWGTQ